jgi:hypothetical protein
MRNICSATNSERFLLVAGDHPDVDAHRTGAAQPFEFPLLQNAKKLSLKAGRDIADLIQEKRSMIGCLKASHALCDGAGEGAFLVAEEFALKQAFGDSRAIQADEWAATPAAELVNQACEQFFACTSLAVDNDGRIRRGDDASLPQCILKNLARPHDPICAFGAIGMVRGRWFQDG